MREISFEFFISNYQRKIILEVVNTIDGVSHVSKIASICKLSVAYVSYIIYNLFLKNFVTLVDIFDFENIYRATSKLKDVHSNKNFLEEFDTFYAANSKVYKIEKISTILKSNSNVSKQ